MNENKVEFSMLPSEDEEDAQYHQTSKLAHDLREAYRESFGESPLLLSGQVPQEKDLLRAYYQEQEDEEGERVTDVTPMDGTVCPNVIRRTEYQTEDSPGRHTYEQAQYDELYSKPDASDMVLENQQFGWLRIDLSTGEVLVYAKEPGTDLLLAGTQEGIHQAEKLIHTAEDKDPEPGVYVARQKGPYEHEVMRASEFHQGGRVFHQKRSQIIEDIERFFHNVDFHLTHGGTGTRSILLYGPPGTGKTDLIRSVIDAHSEDKISSITSDLQPASVVAEYAATHDMPAVIAVEDMVNEFSEPSSSLLNWMDGASQPRNEQGAFFIYTTNHRDELDARVMRPGRIDEKIFMGNLEREYALQCADYYLPDDVEFSATDISDAVSDEPGAIIQDLIRRGRNIALTEEQKLKPRHIEMAMSQISQRKREQESYNFEE